MTAVRVAHRLALDFPERLEKLCPMDIVPGGTFYADVDRASASAYWHWFFLIQPAPLPERLLAGDPDWFVRSALTAHWKGEPLAEDVLQAYCKAFRAPEAIHATCEDYRAGASVDLEHDEADTAAGRRIACPLLLLWGAYGLVGLRFSPL